MSNENHRHCQITYEWKQEDKNKAIDVLLKFYEIKQQEIARIRDYQWKITVWAIGFFVAFHALYSKTDSLFLKVVHLFLLILITGGAIWAILYFQKRLETYRKVREDIENRCLTPIIEFLPYLYEDNCVKKGEKANKLWLNRNYQFFCGIIALFSMTSLITILFSLIVKK